MELDVQMAINMQLMFSILNHSHALKSIFRWVIFFCFDRAKEEEEHYEQLFGMNPFYPGILVSPSITIRS
jgi:hypothetical protein